MSTLTRDELLILLIEECGEVIQAATKCLRFGYDADHGVGYGRNDVVLSREAGDLVGCLDALPLVRPEFIVSRKSKIERAEKAKETYGRSTLEGHRADG